MVGIRADANETVATGHIMRCITIAHQLKKRGEAVLFFVADEYALPILEQAGMDYICLHTQWDKLEDELPVLQEQLKRAGCKKLLVDSYYVTDAYFAYLNQDCRIIYIDDMFEAVYPVDMIINYNAYHTRFPYMQAYGKGTSLLLGTSYVPLREEFSVKEEQPPAAEGFEAGKSHILLSCGGGDTYDALTGILSCLVEQAGLKDAVFHTVVGRFHRNQAGLKQIAKQYEQVVLHYDVSHMAALMSRCTAAVSAAGTVLFELCAMQVPTVFFVCADNQRYDREFFEVNERMLFAGDIRKDRGACIRKTGEQLERILLDVELQQRMKKKLHEVTDGNGAARLARQIMEL